MSSVQTQTPPEALGPGIETEGGGIVYGQPGSTRIGPIPRPERDLSLPERCVNCDGLPAGLLQSLSGLARQAGCPHTGCWWCGQIPAGLLDQLRYFAREGAAR